MANSPEREAAFQKLKQSHGSFWKFHGSAFHNWHSILRTNLRNVSNTALMRAGAAHGPGIYLASNSQTSRQGKILAHKTTYNMVVPVELHADCETVKPNMLAVHARYPTSDVKLHDHITAEKIC